MFRSFKHLGAHQSNKQIICMEIGGGKGKIFVVACQKQQEHVWVDSSWGYTADNIYKKYYPATFRRCLGNKRSKALLCIWPKSINTNISDTIRFYEQQTWRQFRCHQSINQSILSIAPNYDKYLKTLSSPLIYVQYFILLTETQHQDKIRSLLSF